MNLGLHDKIALVTAASRGLGRAVAYRLAQEGAYVAICARGEEDLSTTAVQIEAATGRQVLSVSADVTDPQAVENLVEATIEKFGRIDILVTNAGGPPPGRFLDLGPQDWEAATRLTLMSAVRLCYAVVPSMKQQGTGSILAMTSVTTSEIMRSLSLTNGCSMRQASE